MVSLRLHILLGLVLVASPLMGQHYRGAAGSGQQQSQQPPRKSSQMMGQQGQGGGGGQGQQGGKSREAAEKSIKDGEEVRKALTKTSEQFAQGANKLTENFNSALAGFSKSNSDDEFKDLLKQIKETSTVSTGNPTSTVIDEIVNGYKAQADVLVKKAQIEAAAIVATPKQELTIKPTTFDKLSSAGGRGGGSALGDALSVSSAASENIPSLAGGAAVTRSPSSLASSQGTTGPVSSSASASEPPPSIGSHAKGVR